jgi:hypothetical protein
MYIASNYSCSGVLGIRGIYTMKDYSADINDLDSLLRMLTTRALLRTMLQQLNNAEELLCNQDNIHFDLMLKSKALRSDILITWQEIENDILALF